MTFLHPYREGHYSILIQCKTEEIKGILSESEYYSFSYTPEDPDIYLHIHHLLHIYERCCKYRKV